MLNIYNSQMIGNSMNLLPLTNLLRKFLQANKWRRRCTIQKNYLVHHRQSRKRKCGTGSLRR
jgi:hypothetical protein